VLALLLAACFPPPLDESGRRCDVMHTCSSGFLCFDGVCLKPEDVDAGPDNWIDNGGFERLTDAGEPIGWRSLPAASGGDLDSSSTYHYEGVRSVRLFSPDGGDQPGVQQSAANVRNTVFGQIWCARAAARSNQDAGLIVRLFVRERDDAGVVVGENTPNSPRAGPEWIVLEEKYSAEGAARMDVRVVNGNRIRKQDWLWVDDIRLKRSPNTECTW
jgi:hypothetical protein